MDMAGKAKAGLQGPAGFLSEARLEAYLEKLDPARGVSDPARGVSRAEPPEAIGENENHSHYAFMLLCAYAHMIICRYRCMRIAA